MTKPRKPSTAAILERKIYDIDSHAGWFANVILTSQPKPATRLKGLMHLVKKEAHLGYFEGQLYINGRLTPWAALETIGREHRVSIKA